MLPKMIRQQIAAPTSAGSDATPAVQCAGARRQPRPRSRRRARRAAAAAARIGRALAVEPQRRRGPAGRRRPRSTGSRPSSSASANASSTSLIGPDGHAGRAQRCDPVVGGLRARSTASSALGERVGVAPRAPRWWRSARRRAARAGRAPRTGARTGGRCRPRPRTGGRRPRRSRTATMLGWRLPRRVRHDAARHPGRALVEQRRRARSPSARPRRGGRGRCARARPARPGCPSTASRPQTRSTTAAPTFSGRPSGLAGDAHQPAHRLQQEVVAGQPARRARRCRTR